jgi:predicted ATPase/DNA-binding XRE family transcriptional regulator
MTADQSPLGSLLRRHRATHGLTQEEVAEHAGISARTVSDVERGLRTTIYRDTATRLASALHLDNVEREEFERVARRSARRGPPKVPSSITATRSTRIPIPATSLVGRERELAVVSAALAEPDIRLLTLTGPGGVGKTRIAIEAATRAADEIDRICFLSLSSLQDHELLASTISVALGAALMKESAAEAIAEKLGGGSALLVLDTFEHLMNAAPFVGDLVARCGGLKVLVTSREALHLNGEHEVLIPTLDVPSQQWDEPAVGALRSASTKLFIQRARAVKSDLMIEDESVVIIRDICLRLNGLPLAIELAAARIKHLSLAALKDELDVGFRVLSGGQRDLPKRQQTMRDTVAWSYELLTPAEQALFRWLSVFAGGWTLEAASATSTARGETSDVLPVVSALVDKSLIFLSDSSTEPARYEMLDIILAFAQERCEAAGEMERLRQDHAEFHVALAERAEPQLGSAEQVSWFQRLEIEHDNLRAALAWFIGKGDEVRALRLSGALWQFWRRQGYLSEGRMWLRRALSVVSSGHERARAKALWGAGWLAFAEGDYDEGEALSDELIGLSRELHEPLDERNALTILGMILLARGRPHDAVEPFGRAIEVCEAIGSGWHLATSHLNLGIAKMHAAELADAEDLISTAHDMYADVGDENFRVRCVSYLGYISLLSNDGERAASLFQASLERFRDLGDRQGIAESIEGLAAVAAARNTRDGALAAARLHGAALSMREDLTAKQYPFDRIGMDPFLEKAKAAIGANKWRQAREQGRDLPEELAIDLASTVTA